MAQAYSFYRIKIISAQPGITHFLFLKFLCAHFAEKIARKKMISQKADEALTRPADIGLTCRKVKMQYFTNYERP